MRRLVIFSSEFPPGPGGIGTHAYQLAQHLTRSNWEIHVLTLQDYATTEDVLVFNSRQDFEITRLLHASNQIAEVWNRWQSLRKIIQTWHPDVLIVTGDRQVWIAAIMRLYDRLIARQNKYSWCAVWHGMIPPDQGAKKISCWAFGKADLVISVSQYSLGQLLKMGAQPKRSLIITNGADDKRFYPDFASGEDLRKKLGLIEKHILLTVGHVTERKGQDIVIRALPEILKTIPNVHYLMVGLPTLQASYQALARLLGVSEHVHFFDRIETDLLNSAYNACDLFVLTSRHSSNGQFEGYGIVVVEAALCAKPSVVTDNSGLVEAVQNGVTGFVVPQNDPRATTQAICKLLQDVSLRKSMGERARLRALQEQTWSICMRQYDVALGQLIR